MPRAYGITNAAPYASAPAVGLAGDTYWNTAQKTLNVSDGTAWNALGGGPPTGAAGGDLSGSFPSPVVAKASGGGFSVPTGQVTVPGPTGAVDQAQVVLGTATTKGRLMSLGSQAWVGLSANDWYDGSAWHQDDATKPSWHVIAYPLGDQFMVERRASSNGAGSTPLKLDSGGTLTLAGQLVLNPGTNITGGPAGMTGLLQLLGGTDGRVILNANGAYGPGDATKSSWLMYMDAVGDQLLFGRRAPNAAAGTISWLLYCTNDGVTHCTLAPGSVTQAMTAAGAATRTVGFSGTAANFALTALNTWTTAGSVGCNTRGGYVYVSANHGLFALSYANQAGTYYVALFREATLINWCSVQVTGGTQQVQIPLPNLSCIDYGVGGAAGAHTYTVQAQASAGNINSNGTTPPGYLQAVEFS